MMRILWALVFCVGIPSLTTSQAVLDSVVSDTFHLSGLRVARHKPMGVTKRRIFLRGVPMPNGGCEFITYGPRVGGWSEWEEETDWDTCITIHGQGPGNGGPQPDSSHVHFRVVPFSVNTADTQTVPRKKKP